MKPTLNGTAQPAATEQAVPMKSMQFNTPLVAGRYVNTHTTDLQYSITHARPSEAVLLIRLWSQLLFSCNFLVTLQPLPSVSVHLYSLNEFNNFKQPFKV